MDRSRRLDAFVDLSVALTGFAPHELIATGNTETFHDLLAERCGQTNAEDLVGTFADRVRGSEEPDRAMRLEILGDARFGPMARNLLRLWYAGLWKRMPEAWRADFAPHLADDDTVPSRTSYTEGLLWPAVGSNPPGAKPFGYAMWAKPPRATIR